MKSSHSHRDDGTVALEGSTCMEKGVMYREDGRLVGQFFSQNAINFSRQTLSQAEVEVLSNGLNLH